MPKFTNWRPSTALSCCSFAAVLLVAVVWNVRRKSVGHESPSKRSTTRTREDARKLEDELSSDDVISELAEANWVCVGRVQELYFYPLKSGRGKRVENCDFTEFGISIEERGLLTLQDRMFLVYNEETRKFQTGRNYPTLILVSLSAVDGNQVKLEAVGMPKLVFRVPENTQRALSEAFECSMWWGEPVKCIDCGPEAAKWISRFLTGTSGGLRIGYAPGARRNIMKGPWERFTKVYKTLRNEDSGLFADIASYMLMTNKSLDELNRHLEEPVTILQFRPNILVDTEYPFAEDAWEWIRIGESAIIRNVKPCPRCAMVKINPRTGQVTEEPLKTLRVLREQKEPERVKVDGTAPTFGIYCGLYRKGQVRLGDPVFVHVPRKEM